MNEYSTTLNKLSEFEGELKETVLELNKSRLLVVPCREYEQHKP